MEAFFKDLKIVELANVLAGPAAGLFFSELGAEVIKVENKKSNGDVTRSWRLASEKKENISAYYASVNWNKKSMMADLSTAADREKVYELIRKADVVISNYSFGDDVKLGMDDKSLRKINPQLIHARLSGFGRESSRTAYDLVLQAESGFMHMNGTKESGPLKMPVALIDVLAAHQLKEGILVALIKKLKTGEGSIVDVSLKDAAIASLANQASNWLMAGYSAEASGSLHPNIAPYGETFTTADKKKLVLAVGSDAQFRKLCELLKVVPDGRFINNTERIKHRKELFQLLQDEIIKHDSDALMKEFISHDVPAGMIRSVKDVFEQKDVSRLLLEEEHIDQVSRRVRTAIFEIRKPA
jgi:crotonobetainyl-CoA:carnitine CoA-transferase CaiB-like acyl-CoA transferase